MIRPRRRSARPLSIQVRFRHDDYRKNGRGYPNSASLPESAGYSRVRSVVTPRLHFASDGNHVSHALSTVVDHLAEARSGSREAVGTVLETYRPYLTKIARHKLDPDLAAKGGASDLVQETFLEAVRDFGRFTGSSPDEFKAWLRCLLVHHAGKLRRCYQATHKRKVSRETSLDAGSMSGVGPVAHHTSPSGRAVANERASAVERAIARLPAEYGEVIRLRYREQRSLDEIAALLGRTPNSIAVLWFRAIRRVREELGAEL